MVFHKLINDTEDIEELKFFQFLKIKKIDYKKDINKLGKSLGHYYYCYCRDNGYKAQDLSNIGCTPPHWMGSDMLC